MATVAYGKKQLQKLGTVHQQGGKYWVEYHGYCVSFLANGENRPDQSMICEHTVRIGQEADSQTDYFPGSYWPNLTQAIRYASRP